jgi:uncharacterized membrane protein
MDISPEERKKIFTEENLRIERKAATTNQDTDSSQKTNIGLAPNIEAFLCYLGLWVTGIIFLIVEQKNAKVRLHATQSILVFGTLSVAGWFLGWIPDSGGILSFVISVMSLVLWIILMVKAYRNEAFEIPLVSTLARQLIRVPNFSDSQKGETPAKNPGNRPNSEIESPKYVPGNRVWRLVGSSLAITASSAILILMNYYHQYIAIYHGQTSNGVTAWIKDPILNQDVHQWLPILNIALFASIVGYLISIIWDKYLIREPIKIFIDILALFATISLIAIFPFDFSSFTDSLSIDATRTGVTFVLILLALGIGIGILVRSFKLIANISMGKTKYQP